MGRKAKISYEIKIKFVEEYLNGNISQNGIAKELGLHISSIQEWIRKYKIFGPDGLRTLKNNTYYNSDLKLSAVKDYINGIGSLADICLKYSIFSTGILKQ
ncbi:helix-turn-helix domain-containing protein [Clostridium perfringens]|nr:helix-turn-helix domain-containing protein [Clostridium perfringens]